jgi:hypothetical protein
VDVTEIPPNWLTSITGTQGAQHQSGAHKLKETAEQAKRSGATPFADSLHNVIENEGQDSQVYTDAEGTGSQGRAYADEAQSDENTSAEPESGHVDLEA